MERMEGDKIEKEEIERKFLVKKIPDNLEQYRSEELIAGYFRDSSGDKIRIRQEGDKYFKVKKKGSGLVRKLPEGEPPITKEEFDELWPKTEGWRLRKTRYFIPSNQGMIQLDIFHDALEGHTNVEVEFDSEDLAPNFIPPDWFGKEVTGKKKYSSSSLAKNGLPK